MRLRDGKGWWLQANRGNVVHNHKVATATYDTYATLHGINDRETAAHVDAMVSALAKRHVIYNYRIARGENVYKRDVNNIVWTHRTSVAIKDDDAATAIEIDKFAVENEGSVIIVDETAAGETGVIFDDEAQISARFGELILVDCNHKTNRYVPSIAPGREHYLLDLTQC